MSRRGRIILMTFFGAIGIAVFVALSAWLGAFEGRSDVFFPWNDSSRAGANASKPNLPPS